MIQGLNCLKREGEKEIDRSTLGAKEKRKSVTHTSECETTSERWRENERKRNRAKLREKWSDNKTGPEKRGREKRREKRERSREHGNSMRVKWTDEEKWLWRERINGNT